MLNDIKALLATQNRFLIRKSLGKGILVALLGSIVFVTLVFIPILVRAPDGYVDVGFFVLPGLFCLVSLMLTLFPAILCVAFLTLRLQPRNYKSEETRRKFVFVVEGAALGGTVSLGIGLFVSFLNALLIESIGKGSMRGVTLFTIDGTLVGTITGGITAFFLVKGQSDISPVQ